MRLQSTNNLQQGLGSYMRLISKSMKRLELVLHATAEGCHLDSCSQNYCQLYRQVQN